MRYLILFPLLVGTIGAAQYNGPESVEYDPVGDRYFVSNTQTSRIKVRDQAGTVIDFALTPNAPYGLEIMGDVLYACMGNGVRGYSLATGAEVYYRNLGASFPNGITTDGEHLYITDFNSGARRIYKVDPVGDMHSTLVPATGQQPNGIVWDPVGDRLVVVFWGSNAPIKAYDRNTGAETVLVANTGLGNIDGVTIDCDGNFLVASWNPARITRYGPGFTAAGVNMGITPLSSPADIDFDHTNQRVCIPNSGSNTVLLADYTCLTSNVPGIGHGSALTVWPNPTAGLVHVQGVQAPTPVRLVDVKGQLVHDALLQSDRPLDLTGLPAGSYYLICPTTGDMITLIRE